MALPERMLGLTRRRMDVAMLEAARDAGVRVLQPARCEQIIPGNRPAVRYRTPSSGHAQIEAAVVLLADGKAPAGASTGEFGVKFHLPAPPDWPAGAIELFALGDEVGYVGTAPVEDGLINVAAAVTEREVASSQGRLHHLAKQILAGHPTLHARIGSGVEPRGVLTCPLPRHRSTHWSPGVIPLGNAACAIEPIGGEGMGMALRSAELACEQIVDAIHADRPVDVDAIQSAYATCWSTRPIACRLGALGLRSEALGSVATIAGRATPWLARGVMSLIGKGPAGH